jgi:hypothetical protein
VRAPRMIAERSLPAIRMGSTSMSRSWINSGIVSRGMAGTLGGESRLWTWRCQYVAPPREGAPCALGPGRPAALREPLPTPGPRPGARPQEPLRWDRNHHPVGTASRGKVVRSAKGSSGSERRRSRGPPARQGFPGGP